MQNNFQIERKYDVSSAASTNPHGKEMGEEERRLGGLWEKGLTGKEESKDSGERASLVRLSLRPPLGTHSVAWAVVALPAE